MSSRRIISPRIAFSPRIASLAAIAALVAPEARADDVPADGPPRPAAEAPADAPPPSLVEKKKAEEKPDDVLPEVIVTGRTAADGVPTVPIGHIGARDVFGPERVRETGAVDANGLIQYLPAFSSRPYNGGEAAAPNFSVRGLPDDGLTEYTHILIDGVPANPQPYGWTALSFLPIAPERIFAIDAHRGGYAVRYSPNTVGGVLNLISRPVPVEPTFEVRTTVGSFDYFSTHISGGGTVGDVGGRASFVDRRGDGYRDEGEFHQQDANVSFRYALGPESWVAASLSYIESEHKAPGGLTPAQFAADRFANARPRNRFEGYRGVIDTVLHVGFDEGFFEAYSYASKTRRNLFAQRPQFGAAATMALWEDDSYFAAGGVRVQKGFELAGMQHEVFAGMRYHREWLPGWELFSEPFAGGPITQTQDAHYSTDSLSWHVDDTITVIPNLTVQLGARIEWVPSTRGYDGRGAFRSFEDDFFAVLPGVGASYAFTENLAAFATWHRGFRAPQYFGYNAAPGSDRLDFELGWTGEAGVRFLTVAGFSGSAGLWYLDFDDVAIFANGIYENLGRIQSQGVDLVVDWSAGEVVPVLDGLSLGGSVTFQHAELREGPFRGNEVPYAWEEKAAWRLRYEREGWVGSIGGTYVGGSYSDDANTRPENATGNIGRNDAWSTWDVRGAKILELGEKAKLELAVGATNIFDTEWEVHSRGGFFGPGLIAGPPLQVYASVGLDLTW